MLRVLLSPRVRKFLSYLGLLLIMAVPVAAETVKAGPYEVEVTTRPDPPVVGDNEVQLTVTHNGQPAPDVEVHLTHDMVGMSMNMTPPTLSREGPGRFTGTLQLSMPGLWKLVIHVQGPEGEGSGQLQLEKVTAGSPAAQAQTGDPDGRYRVSLETTPSPPTVGDIPVRVEVRSVEDLPVGNATVMVGADMPGMAMGLRPATARETQPGVYEAVVPLSMEGLWKVTVEVNGESQVFSLVVGRPATLVAWVPWLLGGLALLGVVIAVVRGWRPPLWQVAVLAVLALAAWGLSRYAAQYRPADKSMGMEMDMAAADMGMNISDMQAPVPVVIQAVERGEVRKTVTYTGTVKPFLEETVFPRVEGWLLELPLYPGDRVRQGQEVGRLDDRELAIRQARAEAASKVSAARIDEARSKVESAQAGVDIAAARLEMAQKQLEQARAETQKTAADLEYWRGVFEREGELLAAGAVSQEEFEEKRARKETARVAHRNAQLAVDRVQAEVEAQRAALEQARRQVEAARAGVTVSASQERESDLAAAEQGVITDYTVLRSGISGVVTERITDPGVLVRPGTPLLKVAQIDQVRLQFTVAEEDLAYIRRGTEVKVTSEALERPLTAQITSLFHTVDQGSRTGLVEALVANPDDQLLPGSYVVGEFTLRRESDVLWIPRSAVIRYYQEPAVWVEAEQGGRSVALRRPVETGAEGPERVEIQEGLSAGDRVIVAGHRGLIEGAPITSARSGEGPYRDLLLPEMTDTPENGGHQH